jgi:two-component system, chemotaxis family, response regulator Rcp1
LAPTDTATLLEPGIASLEIDAEPQAHPYPLTTSLRSMTLNADRTIEILLVEDNPADVRLTREIFENGHDSTHLNVVRDGEEAMAFIRREGPYADSPRPQLVLLDLNLPRKDGREVLQELKTDADLCQIPVVVLTTSAAESDIIRSYQLHANCFITKPLDLDEFFEVVSSIKDFWLANARLPST